MAFTSIRSSTRCHAPAAAASRSGVVRGSARPVVARSSRKEQAAERADDEAFFGPHLPPASTSRRELMLNSVNVLVLGSVLSIGGAPRPGGIGIQDYGGGVKTLALCPSTPNCIATSEEANDPTHYVPAWTYNPQDSVKRTPLSQEEAIKQLRAVVDSLKPDGFEPKVIKQTGDYLYVEYTSPFFGFVDDVEFWFKPGPGSRVEYRSASRIGESDGDINRKRIRAIRKELEKKGWASVGF